MAVPRGLLAVVGGALSGVGAGLREEQKQKQSERERQAQFLMQQRLEELRHEFRLDEAKAEHGFRMDEQRQQQQFEVGQSEAEFRRRMAIEKLRHEFGMTRLAAEQAFQREQSQEERAFRAWLQERGHRIQFLNQKELAELRHRFDMEQLEAQNRAADRRQERELAAAASREELERRFKAWMAKQKDGSKENTVQYSSVQGGKLVIVYRDGKREIIDIGEPQKKDAAKVKTTAVDKDGNVWLINEDGTSFRTPIQTATATNKEFREAVETAIKSAKRPDVEGGDVDWETATRMLEEMGFGDKARAIFQPRMRAQIEHRARQRAEELWEIQKPGLFARLFGTDKGLTFDELYRRILAEELAAAGLSAPQQGASEPTRAPASTAAPQQTAPGEGPPAMDLSRLPEGAVVEDDAGRVWQKQGGRFVRRPDLDDRVKRPQEQPARRAL